MNPNPAFAPWPVVHIDLSRGIEPLGAQPGIGGLFLVFWWKTLPLGQHLLPSTRLPLSNLQLAEIAATEITAALGGRLFGENFFRPLDVPPAPTGTELLQTARDAHPLQALDAHLTRPGDAEGAATTSVVVCTRDRPEPLARCLRSLLQLSPPPLEILVVDNAPRTSATRELVENMPEVRYILEPRAGLDVARNTGARHARGTIVAYTDDDVEVHPEWVARLQRGFDDSSVWAVTGLVLPCELETAAQWFFETEWGLNKGYVPRTFGSTWLNSTKSFGAPVWEIGAGANMAFRREAIDRIGWFDERLDVGAAGCSGDSEFWYRVLAAGGHCRYEPGAIVFHHHRHDLKSLRSQIYYYTRGGSASLLIQYQRYGHRGNLRRLFLTLPRYFASSFVRDSLQRNPLSTVRYEVTGTLSGILFYMRHRNPQ